MQAMRMWNFAWMLTGLISWSVVLSPHVALAAENPCGDDEELERVPGAWLAEFHITREGAVTRRTVLGTPATFDVTGEEGDKYWVRVERVHYGSLKADKKRWCAVGLANDVFRLPVSAVQTPDFFRISVYGKYKESDKPAIAKMRKREQNDARRKEVKQEWTRHAFRRFKELYSLNKLIDGTGELTAEGAALRAGIVSAFQPAGSTLNCYEAGSASTEVQGICEALREIDTEILSTVLTNQRADAYQKIARKAAVSGEEKAFCESAHEVNAVERTESLDYVLLSANELPISTAKDTYDLTLGAPKRVFDGATVGAPVVTWIHGVPVEESHEVTWKLDAAIRSSKFEPLVRFVGFIAKTVVKEGLSPAIFPLSKVKISRGFSEFAPSSLLKGAAHRDPTLLEEFGLDGYCGKIEISKIKLPVLASKGSRVHVAEPLQGYEAYHLTVCAGGSCAEGKSSKESMARAEVHTRAEGWRMSLSLGFNAHARVGDRPFQSWRWRPVGSTTGSEQLYQYSRTADPLAHSSASLLLTFLFPEYLGPGQLGIALGPSLLIGTELQPLRQWTAHGVWALEQGFHLTVGAGVRFEDVPMELAREGELQLVSRSSGGAPPGLDQRREAAVVFNVGFALDLGFVADGGEALLKQLGVM